MIEKVKVARVKDVKLPTRGTTRSAGLDFYVPFSQKTIVLKPHERCCIPSGIKMKVPEGFALISRNKSGIFTKHGLAVGADVVDEDYQGEIHLSMYNTTDADIIISPGDKILQSLLMAVIYPEPEEVHESELFDSVSERGEGGFGSTNKEENA